MPAVYPRRNLRRVYCAGPLFNAAERLEMEMISQVLLDAGFETFVPHADGMEFAEVRPYLVNQGFEAGYVGQLVHESIFALDTYQVIVGCGSLVFNFNGRVPDEGGVAEMTMAWMLGKPIVIYKEDARSTFAGRDNPLVVGQTNFDTVSKMDELPAALAKALAGVDDDPNWEPKLPDHLLQTLEAGAQLWSELDQMGPVKDVPTVAQTVLDLFGKAVPLPHPPSSKKLEGRVSNGVTRQTVS